MKKVLITGGTVFVSRFVADYYVKKEYEVYVLNRNTKEQVPGVHLIEADRHNLNGCLKEYSFDVVMDITAYNKEDVKSLIEELGEFKDYIFISSSAVYPEKTIQPFREEYPVGANKYWGDYGVNKYEAEQYLRENVPQAYILRPPYFYGPMENLYREPFIFDCALAGRTFYVPAEGRMSLQFFHVKDLCRFMDIILEKHPDIHIFNVGNDEIVDVNEWVRMCYLAAGKIARICQVKSGKAKEIYQREYFCFNDYDYRLDVSRQNELMPKKTPLREGLKEAYSWYVEHQEDVNKKPYFEFIDEKLLPQMEHWDIYDVNRVKTGNTMIRGEGFKEGCYHLVVHVCIFNKFGEMLIQQRQPFKEGWSGMWDTTLGGSALAGETSADAAMRETSEEIGLEVDLSNVRPQFTVNFKGGFDDYYLIRRDIDLNLLKLQYEEVKAVRWASYDDIVSMIDNGIFIPYRKSMIKMCFDMCEQYGCHQQ